MTLAPGKKIYFASDHHFGAPGVLPTEERERKFIRWLEMARQDAAEIYLVGDLFDFWFEYKTVVPKGYVRLLGKLAEITDSGIPVHLFTGNHDMWVFDYLPNEVGVNLFRDPIERTYNNHVFYIGHGDGLGPGDHGYKFLKRALRNPFIKWLFSIIPPAWGIPMALRFSSTSRLAHDAARRKFYGDKERLVVFCKEQAQKKPINYFVFGHRHLPLDISVGEQARYINLGDWVVDFTYAVFNGTECTLRTFADTDSLTQDPLYTSHLELIEQA